MVQLNPTGTRPVGIGIIGLGRAGWGMHVPELQGKGDRFHIAAAFDLIASRREQALESGIRAYDSIEGLVYDPEVEIVDIATRSSDHFEHGKLALSAGKDIVMEKPVTQTYGQALELYEIARNTGTRIFVRHNRRFDPDFLHVREIIQSGILGDIYHIRLCRHSYQRRNDWQTLKQYGGGQLLNWGPHIIDHGLQLLESPVASLWSDLKRVTAAGDAEDHLKIVLRGENKRTVDIEISGGICIPSPTYAVYGTKGSLTATGKQIQLKYLDPAVKLLEQEADSGTPGEAFGGTGTYESKEELIWIEETIRVNSPLHDIWDELYASIRFGKPYPIQEREALEVVRIIEEVKRGTEFA